MQEVQDKREQVRKKKRGGVEEGGERGGMFDSEKGLEW